MSNNQSCGTNERTPENIPSSAWEKIVILARDGAGILTIQFPSYKTACNARKTFWWHVKRLQVKGIRTRIIQKDQSIKLRISRVYGEDVMTE